jgi:hypothetical protein
VNEENAHDTAEFINKKLVAIQNQRKLGDLEELALIIGKNPVKFYTRGQVLTIVFICQTARVSHSLLRRISPSNFSSLRLCAKLSFVVRPFHSSF